MDSKTGSSMGDLIFISAYKHAPRLVSTAHTITVTTMTFCFMLLLFTLARAVIEVLGFELRQIRR